MKVYIAGKITGNENYKAQFESAARQIEALGHIVLNPALLPEGMTAEEYMRICTAMISVCDEIWVLPNYWNSAGTKIEISLCEYCDKPVKYLSGEDWFDYDEWRREEWSV